MLLRKKVNKDFHTWLAFAIVIGKAQFFCRLPHKDWCIKKARWANICCFDCKSLHECYGEIRDTKIDHCPRLDKTKFYGSGKRCSHVVDTYAKYLKSKEGKTNED